MSPSRIRGTSEFCVPSSIVLHAELGGKEDVISFARVSLGLLTPDVFSVKVHICSVMTSEYCMYDPGRQA